MLAPWKTASSTAHVRLASFNESPYDRSFHFNPHIQRVVHQHITYTDFTLLPESRSGYFTAAFVRNPYDRVFSGFVQLQRDAQNQPGQSFPKPWIRDLVMRQIADNFSQLVRAEFDFNRWFGLIEEHQIYETGRNSSFPLHPAHYWTGAQSETLVDFVGKTENFEIDLTNFCDAVSITQDNKESSNVSSDSNTKVDTSYPKYLGKMTTATISKINSIFAKDFELFGYKKY
jgi:hypothetical protein